MHRTHAHRKFQPKWVRTRTSQLATAHRNSQLVIAHRKSCFGFLLNGGQIQGLKKINCDLPAKKDNQFGPGPLHLR